MNEAIFWRVVWKEYRQQRSLWCAIMVAGVILQVGVMLTFVLNGQIGVTNVLFAVALGVPTLYSLGCGAALFAGEHESETFPFQQALPVSGGRVFAAKLSFALVSVLALFPLLWCSAWAIANWNLPETTLHLQLWAGGCIAAINVLVWAVLFSLMLRRVLPAAVISGLIATLCGFGSFALVILFGDLSRQQLDEQVMSLWCLTTLIAFSIAVSFGKRWFDERQSVFSTLPALFDTWRSRTITSVAAKTSVLSASNVTVMRRLVWHEWRQSRFTMFWFVVGYFALFICFGCILIVAQMRQAPQWEVLLFLLPVLATACGATVFWSDQQGQHYQFFAEHGVRPRLVWLSRQLVWGSVLAFVALIAITPLFFGLRIDPEIPGGTLGLAVLLFAGGQTCSMFIRSGIVAFFSAVLCSPINQLFYIPGIIRGPTGSPRVTDFYIDQGNRYPRPVGEQLTRDDQLLSYGLRFMLPTQANSLTGDETPDE